MNRLPKIQEWTKILQRQVIGEPQWIDEKNVFEYSEVTVEVISILKLIRAVQSLKTLELLCENGLFIDMGTIFRCVSDCVSEIYYLLEKYPNKSSNVDKFIEHFSQTTIDKHLDPKTESVLANKVHNAMARTLTESESNHQIQEAIKHMYKTFSGYVHSNYSHIMQIYGGSRNNLSFNLSGVLSDSQKLAQFQLVDQIEVSVQDVMAFMAGVFGQHGLCTQINESS